MAASDQHCFYFKAKCCHSFRKNDPLHSLKLAFRIVKGDVLDSNCTCVAGKVGFCNHISALMLKICKFTLFEAKSTKDLFEEKDENPELACTSQLQKWHKKRGGENIFPQPVMEVDVKKTKLDESSSPRGGAGVKCLLYEARKQPNYDPVRENTFTSELSTLDPKMGFAQMSEVTSSTELASSKFGKCPVGSILRYQTSFTESKFSVVANLTSVPRNNAPVNAQELNHYPRFPLSNDNDMVVQRELSDTEEALIKDLIADKDKINSIESATRQQAGCDEWKTQRTYRFTASKYHLISRRQRNHQSFAQSLMHPKLFSSKYVTHGLKYDPIALQQYEKFMFNRKTPVAVLKSGFVVSKSCPVLGASPDAKVVDFGCSLCFGLAEVKCPPTKFHVTPLEACSDPTFFMEKVSDTDCKLKRDHPYYAKSSRTIGGY